MHHGFLGRGVSADLALQAALAHHQHAIGQGQHFGQIARHHQHRESGLGLPANHLVNLELGAHIHALGGLVQQQHLGIGGQPLGGDHLLLVAAAQAVGQGRDVGAFDPPVAAETFGVRMLRLARNQPAVAQCRARHDQVVEDRQVEQQALSLPLFGHQCDAGAGGVARRPGINCRAVHADLPRRGPVHAEHGFKQLRSPGPDQAEQADNLTRGDLERDVAKVRRA